jgi:carbamoylphosphate synthase large subunit
METSVQVIHRNTGQGGEVLIRWGLYTQRAGYEVQYNRKIKNASDKIKMRKQLKKAGVPIPTTWYYLEEAKIPCITRPRKHHSGKKFWYCQTKDELSHAYYNGDKAKYYSAVYPKTSEYRVHVGHNRVLCMSKKIYKGNWDATPPENLIVWNHENGFEFHTIDRKKHRRSISKIATNAVEALGLDFGSVDVMTDPKDDSLPNAVVVEVNTCPRVESHTAKRFAKYFDWLLAVKYRKHKEKVRKDDNKIKYTFLTPGR